MNAQAICSRTLKVNAVVLAAALVTFLLFYFMQFLISTDNPNFEALSLTRLIDATVPEFKQELLVEIEKPELFEPPQEITPQEPRVQLSLNTNTAYTPVFETTANPLRVDGVSIPLSRQMVPLVRATAPYPARALQRGIEGFVELSFTVNAQGRVEDPVVLYAEPEGYFERSALNSIQKWQYSPAMDNGVAIPVHDIRQRIVFEISTN